ncbi:MAG: carboxypeptidase regulatory-like domain-containing protein [Acidobacteria bacterium]|nr:carboxypeptidase regulatory-like domain-containing protein [Acidobacteriota bacterium]
MKCVWTLVVSLFVLPGLWAQQTGIQGSVTDSTGAVVPNAIVRLLPAGGGAASTTLTGNEGQYVFPALQAAQYKVRVEAAGFTPAERTINLLVGQSLVAEFQLKPAAQSSTVDVLSDAVTIDVSSSQVGGNVDTSRMEDTPLNGRNWMELSLLVPGVTVNAVSNTPLGTVSGGRFQINVDGQQVTQNAAGAGFGQPQFSRETMSQFQVITNRFDATMGRSAQIQVNAQTKSGSNEFHGSAYGYFRSDKFNAADPIGQRVLPFSNKQYGVTGGGRILRDKLFFFGAYEGESQPSTVLVTPQGFGGQSFSFANDFQTKTWIGRVDWVINEKHRLSGRYNGSQWRNPFGNVSGTSHPSQAARQTRDGETTMLDWTWVISPTTTNDVRYGFNYFQWKNNPYVLSQEYRLPGGITVGGPYNYPQEFNQFTNQVRDDLYWLKGAHSVKLGGEYLSNNHTGLFPQNARGTVNPFTSTPANLPSIFPVWNDPTTWNIDALSPLASNYTQGFGNFNIDIPRNVVAGWIQDDWKINKRLTVNLGLRYDNDIGIWSTPTLKSNVVPPRGGQNLNFSPRVGFAYDLMGDRRTVIRGGGGLYFADIQANQVINQSIFNGESSLQVGASRTSTTSINLRDPFNGVSGDDFLSGKVPVPAQNVQLLNTNAVTPYSAQASIGAERQLGQSWTVSGDFVYWRVYREWIRQDRNIGFNPVTGFGTNPSVSGRPDTRFGQILEFTTPNASGAIYYGGQFQVTRRFAKRFSAGAAYTVSKLKDSSSGPFGYPNNQFDLADEWGPSVDDQRHTLNFDGSVQLPWGFQSSMFYHYGSGAAFASIGPGNPFNYAGTSNRTFLTGAATFIDPSYLYPSHAPGYTNVKRNSFRGQPINRIDWRLTKTVAIKERWRATGIFEVFNVINAQNYGTYQSNIGLATFGRPAYNSNLAYAARMLQFAVRFDY